MLTALELCFNLYLYLKTQHHRKHLVKVFTTTQQYIPSFLSFTALLYTVSPQSHLLPLTTSLQSQKASPNFFTTTQLYTPRHSQPCKVPLVPSHSFTFTPPLTFNHEFTITESFSKLVRCNTAINAFIFKCDIPDD